MIRAEIDKYLSEWSLRIDGDCTETPTSWIQPVRRLEAPAILKLLKPSSDEKNAAQLLRYYGGRGAVLLFESDANALLLERATGTRSLAAMAASGYDTEATEILAETLATLHEVNGRKIPRSLTPLPVRFSSLFNHRDANALLNRCADVAHDLIASETGKAPLHGDLHHGNVLDGAHRGWLAIDPKALIGERAYDVANLLCNPWPHGKLVHSKDRMERLAQIYARHLGLDPRRVLDFAYAHAGLWASWDIDDGKNPDYSLKCVETLSSLVSE